MTTKGCVVLLSGGLDSQTLVYHMQAEGYDVLGLHVLLDTRQKQAQVNRVFDIAARAGIPLEVFDISHLPRLFQGSALTTEGLPVGRTLAEIEGCGINPTYVPLRNTVLLSLAGAYAESHGMHYVAYGAHATDGPHYPDTTPEYVARMALALYEGSKDHIQLIAPFISWRKSQIIERAAELRVPVHLSYTCYEGTHVACGRCDSCITRIVAFREAGYRDPIDYEVVVVWEEKDKRWPGY